jgi:hypothetical protein
MTEKIRKKIAAARIHGKIIEEQISDNEARKQLNKALKAVMRLPSDDTNLAETQLSATLDTSEFLDKEYFREAMRLTGCKTKREYVRYMMRLHKGK